MRGGILLFFQDQQFSIDLIRMPSSKLIYICPLVNGLLILIKQKFSQGTYLNWDFDDDRRDLLNDLVASFKFQTNY